jgi:hypothetical protein
LRHGLARGQRRDLAGRRAGRIDQGRGATRRAGAGDRSQSGGNTAGSSHERHTDPGSSDSGTGSDTSDSGYDSCGYDSRGTDRHTGGPGYHGNCTGPAPAFAASGPGDHRGNDTTCTAGIDTSPGRRSRNHSSAGYHHGASR